MSEKYKHHWHKYYSLFEGFTLLLIIQAVYRLAVSGAGCLLRLLIQAIAMLATTSTTMAIILPLLIYQKMVWGLITRQSPHADWSLRTCYYKDLLLTLKNSCCGGCCGGYTLQNNNCSCHMWSSCFFCSYPFPFQLYITVGFQYLLCEYICGNYEKILCRPHKSNLYLLKFVPVMSKSVRSIIHCCCKPLHLF